MVNLIPLRSLTPSEARRLIATAAENESPAEAVASLAARIDWSGTAEMDSEVQDLLAEAEELVTLFQEGDISLFAFKRSLDQLTSTFVIEAGEPAPDRGTSGSDTITFQEEEDNRPPLNLFGSLAYSVR